MDNQRTYEQIKLIETILNCHKYKYSKVYQKVARGLIRVQYDFKSKIENLDSSQAGCLLVTKMLLRNYGINAAIEITDERGIPRILFYDDFEKISARSELII